MAADKLILIGVDSLLLDFVERFMSGGLMPNIKRLMECGSSGYALPSMPTFTPPNWTTIATGTDPSFHGIVGWTFDSRRCRVKHLWTLAAEAGKKSVLIRYPCGWPSTHRNVMVLGDGQPNHSIGVIEEATAFTLNRVYRYSGGLHGTFESRSVSFRVADGWRNPVKSRLKPMEAELEIVSDGRFKPVKWWALVYAVDGEEYDTLLISPFKDCSRKVCLLRRGGWSDFIRVDVEAEDRVLEAVFKFRLVDLKGDLSEFSLFRTQIHALSGFSDPPFLCNELVKAVGPYLDNPSRFCLAHGWYDTYFDELREHVDWIVRAAHYLQRRCGWDLLFVQCHSPDYVQHECWAGIDPSSLGYDEGKVEMYWEIFEITYNIIDTLIGGLSDLADEDTLLLVVSDHGHIPRVRTVFLADILVDEGFLIYDNDGKIDPSKSIIRGFSHDGILLNTRWRFRDGIITSREEYEKIINQIIDLLLSIEDRGRHVVYFAVKASEASFLGVSESLGDIILCPRPGYSLVKKPADKLSLVQDGYIGLPDPKYGMWGGAESVHEGLPSSRTSLGTNMAMFVMSGPNVRRGYRCERPVWLRDIAPTIAYLMGLPNLKDADGRVINEIIEI